MILTVHLICGTPTRSEDNFIYLNWCFALEVHKKIHLIFNHPNFVSCSLPHHSMCLNMSSAETSSLSGNWQFNTDLWPAAAYSGSGSPLCWTRDICTLLKYFSWQRPKTRYHWAPKRGEVNSQRIKEKRRSQRTIMRLPWTRMTKQFALKGTSKWQLLQKMLIIKHLIKILKWCHLLI